jgi:hypothetical protein
LEGNEISKHGQIFLFEIFLGKSKSHKEWTIAIDLKQWHPMLHFELNYYCNVTWIGLLL